MYVISQESNGEIMFRLIFLFTTFTLLFISAPAAFAASVSITPAAAGTYSVQGDGMDGVAGIQLDIAYDAASLATPTITQGALVGGAMLAANTSIPGIIKIAIISTRAFSGSGTIATISFASNKGSGGITSITASMIDSKGSSLTSSTSNLASATAAAGDTSTPGVPFSQTTQQVPSPAVPVASRPVSTSPPTYLGTVTLPTDQQKQGDSQPSTSSTVPDYAEEPKSARIEEQTLSSVKPSAEAKNEESPQFVVYKGILDRFKQYQGSKQLSSMVTLFDRQVAQNINQEPAIVVSNGQSKATLTVDIPARISSLPNFAVSGGTLVSFRQDKQIKSHWVIEVLPEAGSLKVAVTIIAGAEGFEYPLTIVTPVKMALTLDESGWNRFLSELGTTTAPLHDLNNDGVRDYMDEFIFVANYLVKKSAPVIPPATSNKSVK